MPAEILAALRDVFAEYDQSNHVERIERMKGLVLHEVLSELTKIERASGLPAALHGLVAQAKQAIAGSLDRQDFLVACFKLQGLV